MEDGNKKKLILLVMEGFGISPSFRGNAVFSANPENFFKLWKENPHTVINCSGDEESYPSDNTFLSRLFSGAEVLSDHTFIDEQIKNQKFFFNEVFSEYFDRSIKQNSVVHLIGGLSSRRGKFGDIDHLINVVKLAKSRRIYKVCIHLLLDDSSAPDMRTMLADLDVLNRAITEIGCGEIASITGARFLDDKNLNSSDFITAFRNIVMGKGKVALSAEQAVAHYENYGSSSKFPPVTITFHNKPIGKISDFDCVVFYNFDNSNISKFILSLVQNSAPYRGCEVPKFLDVLTMLPTIVDDERIKTIFHRTIKDGISEILLQNNISQFVLSDSSRIDFIKNIYLSAHQRNSNLIKTTTIPTSLNLSQYFSNYEQTLLDVLQELSKEIANSCPDIVLVILPSINRAARDGSVQDVINQIKLHNLFLPKLIHLAKDKSYNLMITSSHGLSANLSQAGVLRQNLGPFIFIECKHERASDTSPLKDFHGNLMYDILKKKHSLLDVAPTVLEWFGVQRPETMKGQSFLKELRKEG